MKIVLTLVLFGLVRAQNADNPIQRIAERFGVRARGDSSLLKGLANRTISRVENVLREVKNRSDLLEKRAKDDIQKVEDKINQLSNRLRTNGGQQRETIEAKINQFNQKIQLRKDKLKDDLTKQKDKIQSQLKLVKDNETKLKTKLENEIKRLSARITAVNGSESPAVRTSVDSNPITQNRNRTKIIPQVRGLGDGYGRQL